MIRRMALAALVLVAAGCAMARHREQVGNGMLTMGLHREAFMKEWGPPAQTFVKQSMGARLRFKPFSGTLHPAMYEVWAYPSRQTCLAFDGVRLQSWVTGVTVCDSPDVTAKLGLVTNDT